MINNQKTNQELHKELADLKLEYTSLKSLNDQNIIALKKVEETLLQYQHLTSGSEELIKIYTPEYREITEQMRTELERQIVFEIVNGITTTNNLNELLKLIHLSLGKRLYAENCFIALYDQKSKLFSFPYFVDKFDPTPEPLALQKSCTAYIFRIGKPALIPTEVFEKLIKEKEVELVGWPSPSWIGVPLKIPARTIGVLVLQHYEKENVYSERDVQFLDLVGSQIALAIERKRLDEVLQHSEDRYRDLVENSNDLICTHDLDGNLLSLNNTAIKISGYSGEEAIKLNLRDIVVSDYRSIFDSYLDKIKARGHAHGIMKIQTKSGEIRIWEYNNTLRTEGIAKPIVRGMVKDVTRLKNTESILKKLNLELNKSNSEKNKFFSIIAHDLISPFNGFLGLTKSMAQNANNISALELNQLGSTMFQAADNLFKLLQNLLEWAQMQSGSITVMQKNISLSQLIIENLEVIKVRSEQKGILINNLITESIHAYADEKMINSVLLNLLSNAVKFSDRNGTISVSSKKIDNQMIEISIKDTGVGMPAGLVQKLFKVGEKTGRKGTKGELSTGLGLLLCKEFVEKNDGKIWVESQVNIGTTFYFTLPC
jgi:PAS domain S-box-containing protein